MTEETGTIVALLLRRNEGLLEEIDRLEASLCFSNRRLEMAKREQVETKTALLKLLEEKDGI